MVPLEELYSMLAWYTSKKPADRQVRHFIALKLRSQRADVFKEVDPAARIARLAEMRREYKELLQDLQSEIEAELRHREHYQKRLEAYWLGLYDRGIQEPIQ